LSRGSIRRILQPAVARLFNTQLRYVREFDHEWLRGGAPADDALIGSADIQSLADLGNSFDVVKGSSRWIFRVPG
jgi:hypothetical protein